MNEMQQHNINTFNKDLDMLYEGWIQYISNLKENAARLSFYEYCELFLR